MSVATIGIEAVADHRLTVANHVGDDGDEAQRHLAEVDVGVTNRRFDRARGFENLGDFHTDSD